MAFKLIVFHLLTAMVAVNLICAEDEIEKHFGLPSFGLGNSSGLNFPFSDLFGQLPLPFSFGSRQKRSTEPQEDVETEPQDRLGTYVSCNYTAEGGTRCTGCRQSLACYANNAGRVRTCTGLLRYCNNGRCSFTPGELC